VSWKLLIRLSKISGGRVWWLWMGGVVFGGWRGNVLMYRLISRSSSVAKSCVGGERLGVFVVICVEYRSHSHISLSNGMEAW